METAAQTYGLASPEPTAGRHVGPPPRGPQRPCTASAAADAMAAARTLASKLAASRRGAGERAGPMTRGVRRWEHGSQAKWGSPYFNSAIHC